MPEKGKRLLYPIKISSIHGEEIANEAVNIPSIKIISYGQEVTIPEVKLIVLKHGPADIIIGLKTLRINNVFGLLSHYFGTGVEEKSGLISQTGGQTGGEMSGARSSRTPSQQFGRQTPLNALNSEVVPVGRKMVTVHISELIPNREQEDDTYSLLPDEMYEFCEDNHAESSGHASNQHQTTESKSPSGAGSSGLFEFKNI
jgi:hypothetical protein